MDEDKIIIIPEKYYMQIYQVGFWFLIIMSIICIAYGFFANEKAWLTYTIIGNVVQRRRIYETKILKRISYTYRYA